jgi:hypothetical protein
MFGDFGRKLGLKWDDIKSRAKDAVIAVSPKTNQK